MMLMSMLSSDQFEMGNPSILLCHTSIEYYGLTCMNNFIIQRNEVHLFVMFNIFVRGIGELSCFALI